MGNSALKITQVIEPTTMDINKIQNRIKNMVKVYKDSFPIEYENFLNSAEQNKKLTKDEFATTGTDTFKRKLYEIPETLHNILVKGLDVEELTYLKSVDGGRWFAKTNPDFSTTKE